jgi:hypothetical protein
MGAEVSTPEADNVGGQQFMPKSMPMADYVARVSGKRP